MEKDNCLTFEVLHAALAQHHHREEVDSLMLEIHNYIKFDKQNKLLNEMGEIVAKLPSYSSSRPEWWALQHRFDEIQNELAETLEFRK
jgi:hypothetical protein